MPFFTKSVASITAKLHKTVKELEDHAEHQDFQAELKHYQSRDLHAEAESHRAEHALARRVADDAGCKVTT